MSFSRVFDIGRKIPDALTAQPIGLDAELAITFATEEPAETGHQALGHVEPPQTTPEREWRAAQHRA